MVYGEAVCPLPLSLSLVRTHTHTLSLSFFDIFTIATNFDFVSSMVYGEAVCLSSLYLPLSLALAITLSLTHSPLFISVNYFREIQLLFTDLVNPPHSYTLTLTFSLPFYFTELFQGNVTPNRLGEFTEIGNELAKIIKKM